MGIVTGCLRISRESIFTGLNHLEIKNITGQDLSDFIGFTRGEVHKLLQQCNPGYYEDEAVRWYDGYSVTLKSSVPQSVINFCKNGINRLKKNEKIVLENYRANSSGNDIIDICIQSPNSVELQRMQNLIARHWSRLIISTMHKVMRIRDLPFTNMEYPFPANPAGW